MLKPFFQTPAEGASTAIYLATSEEVATISGNYFINKKQVKTNAQTHDEALARRLWSVSEELVGLNTGKKHISE